MDADEDLPDALGASSIPAAPGPAQLASSTLASKVIAIVAERTGYPTDMLALDLDLEADLGIDTVKQAEIFADLRTVFNIPPRADLRLRDYPTLEHVVAFVRDTIGPSEDPTDTVPAVALVAASTPTSSDFQDDPQDIVAEAVIAIVARQTGYPIDMLALDLDIEADLGIDTVKQAEVFAELRSEFALSRQDDLKLRDYPTLGHVAGYVKQRRPDLCSHPQPAENARRVRSDTPPPNAGPIAEPIAQHHAVSAEEAPVKHAEKHPRKHTEEHAENHPNRHAEEHSNQPSDGPVDRPVAESVARVRPSDDISRAVVVIVSEQTGYPTDMLELDQDLEADLGIDTVKQAEIFSMVRDRFDIPRIDGLKLRDYPTLGHVVQFVRQNTATAISSVENPSHHHAKHTSDTAENAPRRLVPVAMVRLPVSMCKPTSAEIRSGQRVVVVGDQTGAATHLVELLANRGVQVCHVASFNTPQELVDSVMAWTGSHPIDGVFFLPGFDVQLPIDEMPSEVFLALMNRNVRGLFWLARALYSSFDRAGTYFIAATSMGGALGYGASPAQNPCAGPISGFTKAFARERSKAVVKVVDFAATDPRDTVAARLIGEVERDPGTIEVGYQGASRFGVTLIEQEQPRSCDEFLLGPESVVVVSGSGGAITSAIAADLADASHAEFHLIDLPPSSRLDGRDLDRIATDRDGLKRDIMERLRAGSKDRVTPMMVERELSRIDQEAATRNGIRAIEEAGGRAVYHCCDVTNTSDVLDVMRKIVDSRGRIDLIVHAAGIERSRPVDLKDAHEFDLVFGVKAMGMYNLLLATRGVDVGAIVSFSSVAGRFGNDGQVDYSAANDFLCKVTSNLRAIRPKTRGIAIDWTAWKSIGMASRGSIPEIMNRAGIDMLEPARGVPVVREELAKGSCGEIVVCGSLGSLVAPKDRDGGALVGTTLPGVRGGLFSFSSLRTDADEGVVLSTILDPRQRYLDHHRIDGIAVMPGVMGLELFAQAVASLAPGVRVRSMTDVRFVSPLKCYRDQPREAYVTVRLLREPDGDRALCVLHSRQVIKVAPKPLDPKLHFSATLHLCSRLGVGGRIEPAAIRSGSGGGRVGRMGIYRAFFHGPSFQVLDSTNVSADGKALLGRYSQPILGLSVPGLADDPPSFLTAPGLLELCFQTAGVIEIGKTRALGLPNSIEEVRVFAGADGSGDRLSRVRASMDGSDIRFDAIVVNEHGDAVMEVIGYRTSALPSELEDAGYAPLEAGLKGFSM